MIPSHVVQQVKERSDILSVVHRVVRLARKTRGAWIGLCPFHKERTGSFRVMPERGNYHCFGCGEHGNVIDFVMKTEGLNFPEAVRLLADLASIDIPDTRDPAVREAEERQKRARDALYGAMTLATAFYERMLHEHPDARVAQEELARRGLNPYRDDQGGAVLRAFRVGYAPGEWASLTAHLKKNGIDPAVSEKAGLILPRSSGAGHFDAFRNRLMFAVHDLQGRIVAFSGRLLPHPQTGLVDKESGKYINSPETPIYSKGATVFGLYQAKQAIRESGQAIVVEGNFDVVSLHARGIPHAVAPLGTAFTTEQAQALKRFASEAVLVFDGDAAGRKATKAAREPCKAAKLAARAAPLPDGIDPDELVRTRGPAAVLAVVQAARGLLDHLIDACLATNFLSGDPEERAARIHEVIALIHGETDEAVRAMAKSRVNDIVQRILPADITALDPVLHQALRRAVQAGMATLPKHDHDERDRPLEERLAEAVLGPLVDVPIVLDHIPDDYLVALSGDAALAVASLHDHPPDRDPEGLLAALPASLREFVRDRLTVPLHHDPTVALSEVIANLTTLKLRSMRSESVDLKRKLRQASKEGDTEAEDKALAAIVAQAAQRRALHEQRRSGSFRIDIATPPESYRLLG